MVTSKWQVESCLAPRSPCRQESDYADFNGQKSILMSAFLQETDLIAISFYFFTNDISNIWFFNIAMEIPL